MTLSPNSSSSTMPKEGKSLVDITGRVTLRWRRPKHISTEGVYFINGRQYYDDLPDNGQGQAVSVMVFSQEDEMDKKFNDLISFSHPNILMPICRYACNGFYGLSFLPVKCSLSDFIDENKSSLTNREELGSFLFQNSNGMSTTPLNKPPPLDFSPKYINALSTGLSALSGIHSCKHLHGPFDLTKILVSVENEGHPVLERFVLKLNPDLNSDGKSELTQEQIITDVGHYADAILKMCRVLSMDDEQILEIKDMCERMKDGSLYLVSDILKHPCLSDHCDRIEKLRHVKQVAGDIRLREMEGENFPRGSWKAHFKFILERLQYVPGARLNYDDDFSGFLDLARNLLSHFWQMERLHPVMPDEVICVLRLRAYYPLLFVDLE